MKFIAIEIEHTGIENRDFQPHLRAEAQRVWELQQKGIIREIYFRRESDNAVLVLECSNTREAKKVLSTLPLVQAGLIEFEVIALRPYPGLSRLFAAE